MKKGSITVHGVMVACGFALSISAVAQSSTNRPPIDATPAVQSGDQKNDPIVTVKPALTDADRVGRVVSAANPIDRTLEIAPTRPDQNELADPVKEQIELLQRQREEFLKLREILYKKSQSATEEERQKLRERMKELLKRWRDVSRERRVEASIRERAIEAKLEAHKELLQQAREKAQDQVLDKSRDIRRGQD